VEAVIRQPAAVLRSEDAFERAAAARAALASPHRFENLIARHESKLRRLAHGMLADASRVDDVLQEAFIRAYRALPARFESERQEAAWLYRIVHRTCLNELRSRRRRRETIGIADDVVVRMRDADESLAVEAALAALPPKERAVVLLVDLLELDYETVAASLRIPRGTVASRLRRARAVFRMTANPLFR